MSLYQNESMVKVGLVGLVCVSMVYRSTCKFIMEPSIELL